MIKGFLKKDTVRLSEIQKLHGYLNHCAQIIPAGRAFMKSLSNLMHAAFKGPVKVSREAEEDLKSWQEFLSSFNGKIMMISSEHMDDLVVEADSSGSYGCGVILDHREYYAVRWPQDLGKTNRDLSMLELYPLLLAVFIWPEELSNKRIHFYTDNRATRDILRSFKANDPKTRSMLRLFALQCLKINVFFQASHIAGFLNRGLDLLSRGRMETFRREFPALLNTQYEIPAALRPETLLA